MVATLRLADLLAGLSMVADLGFGLPLHEAMRTSVLATGLARRMDLPDASVRDCFYAALLLHIGCVSMAHETTQMWGDDLRFNTAVARIDVSSSREIVGLAGDLARGSGPWERAALTGKMILRGAGFGKLFDTASCEVARTTARRLGLPASTQRVVYQAPEWWKGGGGPDGVKGDEIDIAARIVLAAGDAAFFDDIGDADLAITALQHRVGVLDPDVVVAFVQHGRPLLAELNAGDPHVLLLAAEPTPVVQIPAQELVTVAAAFGDAADLKTPFMQGHSARVATFAEAAATAVGLEDQARWRLGIASRLHDIGRVGISNTVWEKPTALTVSEWEQVRMHAYHSERILSGSEVLRPAARVAGMHHERLDGSGYHRASPARELPAEVRVLAAADAFVALTSDRPHRQAFDGNQAARLLAQEVTGGRLDADAVRAVVDAAGHVLPRRSAADRPAGLSEREVEVLRLLVSGLSNPQIAAKLHISRRTAEHHVQHIYTKIGLSTRPGAALFAIEHDLVAAAE